MSVAGIGRWSASRNTSDVAPVAAEEAQAPVDQVELVEVERGVVDGVLEGVDERRRAAMADAALQEMGAHAARSAPAPIEQLGHLEAGPAAVLVEAVAEVGAGVPRPAVALELEQAAWAPASGTCTADG